MVAVIELHASGVTAVVDPAAGGRLASLVVAGAERLVTGSSSDHPMMWGCFPMVPWAGRVRNATFTFGGTTYRLPADAGPHAIHGTCYTRPWEVEPDGSLAIELGSPWPFGGTARQSFHLDEHGLTCRLEVHAADRAMPAQAGWHPWFVTPVELTLEATAMWEQDAAGIPTGRLVQPSPGPWDDCFSNLLAPPLLRWPDGLAITVHSGCACFVVFNRMSHALCVEPQTGPPDGFNLLPHVVEPGSPLVAEMRLAWIT